MSEYNDSWDLLKDWFPQLPEESWEKLHQYTDLLRDVSRSKGVTGDQEAEQVIRGAGCGQLQLWVAKSSRTIMIGELRLQTNYLDVSQL